MRISDESVIDDHEKHIIVPVNHVGTFSQYYLLPERSPTYPKRLASSIFKGVLEDEKHVRLPYIRNSCSLLSLRLDAPNLINLDTLHLIVNKLKRLHEKKYYLNNLNPDSIYCQLHSDNTKIVDVTFVHLERLQQHTKKETDRDFELLFFNLALLDWTSGTFLSNTTSNVHGLNFQDLVTFFQPYVQEKLGTEYRDKYYHLTNTQKAKRAVALLAGVGATALLVKESRNSKDPKDTTVPTVPFKHERK